MNEAKTVRINGVDRWFDGILYHTKDYSKFKTLLGNREISKVAVKNLIDSMKGIGVLPVPLIVNERYEVIDGQHRLIAIEALKGTAYYIIVPGLELSDCIALNGEQRNWKPFDFIKSYADRHYEQYEALMYYVNLYNDIAPSVVMRAMSGSYDLNRVKKGAYKITSDIKSGIGILEVLRTIKQERNQKAGCGTVAAIKTMLNEGADINLLKEAIEINGAAIHPKAAVGSAEAAYIVLTEIYNKKRSSRRIAFNSYARPKEVA